MKEVRFKVVGMLLLLCLLLSGCRRSLKDYLYTESGLKQEAEKDLEEKYDEEFVIHNAWWSSPGMYTATCSPKSDMEVVFETRGFMDERGVYKDEYLQGVVANQVRDRLQPKIQKIFEDCYVKVTFTFVNPSFDCYEGVTVEDYYEMYENDVSFYLQIFVNKEDLHYDEKKAREEFDCFAKLLDGEIMKEMGCRCYFVDKSTLSECRTYFQQNSKSSGEYDDIVEDKAYFGFGFLEGKINKTFKDYEKIRKEIESNE